MFKALLAAALLTVVVTPAASADPVALECVGTKTTQYSPGLKLFPSVQRIEYDAIFSPCAGTATGVSAIQSSGVTKVASCLSVGESNPGLLQYVWSDGESSFFSYETTVQRPAGQIVVTKTGTITAGRYTGATAVETTTGVTPNVLDCVGDGIKSLPSAVTLSIVGA
ncbi:hypothetical protein Lesp02_45350 [Lentzea sp. NBRC 105346]|uniref:hypothetical protein n=1 Tax=Lentzea sp. NBRC 105346 TaxID=3032205 RepID=UPI0024A2F6F3|nr:hypothetical protein [Lentzea sp. NBRC 105346]GLZ32347.1 hypothetical protein Lesp02_45350 [Lentzea sp. NBRC 105346]